MKSRAIWIILASLTLAFPSIAFHPVSATNNAIMTAPSIVNLGLGAGSVTTFAINVSNVGPSPETLHAWQLYLKLNATLLKITQVIEGPALKDIANALQGTTLFTGKFNATTGLVQSDDLILVNNYPDAGFVGNGTLLYVKVQVLALGTTSLVMNSTALISIVGTTATEIHHTIVNGLFSNIPYNIPPKASFAISPSPPVATRPTTFDASGSYDSDGSIVRYSWNFGDGNQTAVTVPVIIHTYAISGGPLHVNLTVTDDGNPTGVAANASTMETIYVSGYNTPPRALFTFSPSNPRPGQPVTFNATASYDPDGDPLLPNPIWLFSDGGSGGGYIVTHTFNKPGNYTVSLTVTDTCSCRLSDTLNQTVTVSGELVPPVLNNFPVWVIPAGGVGAVVAVAVGLFFLRSRRIRAEEAEDSAQR